jgi:urease accessory protein
MAADVSIAISGALASGDADADAALLPLMLWLSPAFPVGSFAYSQALEWAVESGDIQDARSLGGWLVDLLTFGAPRADSLLFADCFRAAMAEDWEALAAANELAVALANSAERRLETTSQGAAFVVAARAAWDCEPLRQLSLEERVAYPAAVASAAAGHGLPLEASLQAFILAQIAAAVSAVVRLGPIGQTDGQKIQATLIPRIRALAREASGSSLTDLGSCTFRSDIAAMRHETQYSRLFRS